MQALRPGAPVVVAHGHEGDIEFEVTRIRNRRWDNFRIDEAMFNTSFRRVGADDNQVQLLIHSYEAVAQVCIVVLSIQMRCLFSIMDSQHFDFFLRF